MWTCGCIDFKQMNIPDENQALTKKILHISTALRTDFVCKFCVVFRHRSLARRVQTQKNPHARGFGEAAGLLTCSCFLLTCDVMRQRPVGPSQARPESSAR